MVRFFYGHSIARMHPSPTNNKIFWCSLKWLYRRLIRKKKFRVNCRHFDGLYRRMHDMAPQCRGKHDSNNGNGKQKKRNHADVLLFERERKRRKRECQFDQNVLNMKIRRVAKRNEFACILRCICMFGRTLI